MKKIYGLQNDKENISLIVGDGKTLLITQAAESYEVKELNLEFDVKSDKSVSLEEIKPINISANEITTGDIAKTARHALKGIANNVKVDSKVEITEDGIKISGTNKESQPYPVQRALNRIEELNYITDVRIDEEFKATDINMTENRLTITIDYLENNH